MPEWLIRKVIGNTPVGWETVSADDVVYYQEGPGIRSYEYSNGGCRIINVRCVWEECIDLSDARFVSWELVEKQWKHFLISEGDILVTTSGTIGRVSRVGRQHLPLLMNTSVVRFKSLDPSILIDEYLLYFLQSNWFYKQLIFHTDGGIIQNVGPTHIKRTKFLLPPLPEQRKIAEILSVVDEAIENTDTIIKQTEQLKKGLMQKLFTEGIGHKRFRETKIGWIPEEWEIKPLGDLGDFFKGTSIAASEIVENGLPCIRYGDIYVQYENDNVVTHFSAFINSDTAEHSRRIYEGDILFAGTGETQEDIGKCVAYTITEEAYAGGDLIVFRPQKEHQLNSVFLSYCMNCGEVAKAKSRLGQGLSIFHIYSKNLKTLHVPIPSTSEQNKISEILLEFDNRIKTEQAHKAELKQIKKGLMQVLLTGQVRVKV